MIRFALFFLFFSFLFLSFYWQLYHELQFQKILMIMVSKIIKVYGQAYIIYIIKWINWLTLYWQLMYHKFGSGTMDNNRAKFSFFQQKWESILSNPKQKNQIISIQTKNLKLCKINSCKCYQNTGILENVPCSNHSNCNHFKWPG